MTSSLYQPRAAVLVLVSHYLPGINSGGPVRTIANLVNLLGDDFDFRIITLDHDYGGSVPYPNIQYGTWQRVGKAQVRYLKVSEQLPWNLRKIINSCEYNLVYLNGIYPALILAFLNLNRLHLLRKIPILIAPRGQLEHGALSIKPRKKRLFLTASKVLRLYDGLSWHAASHTEENDIQREFGRSHMRVLRMIPNLTHFEHIPTQLGASTKNRNELKMVFLSRVSPKKNLLYALNLLFELQGNIQFDIFGPLENEAYWRECTDVINSLPTSTNVYHKGSLAQNDVVKILSEYHLFFLPTLGENFGHVILEALWAGCPVLISDQTPWGNVQEHGAGWALPLNDSNAFRQVVQLIIDADSSELDVYRQQARQYAQNYLENSSAVNDMRRFLLELAAPPATS